MFEDHVAGIFGAARAPFSFKKLAKQAAHEMEDQTLVVNGVNTAPALFTILVSSEDDPMMAPYYPELTRELAEFVKAQAEKKRYVFVGEPLVRFMIDPALKGGKFSVFAENVDAATLGRLYEEERAYQKGLSQSLSGGGAPTPSPEPPLAGRAPAQGGFAPRSQGVPLAGAVPGLDAIPDPFSAESVPSIPVPKTVTREQLAGMSAAAGAGAAAGVAAGAASSVAQNLAGSRVGAPAAAAPTAQLVDVVTGETFEIHGPRCTVGRERAASDIVLRDPNVSRSHAQITCSGQDWSIEDLNSTNGTLVNNRRVTRSPLRDGDVLTFGLSTFEFRG